MWTTRIREPEPERGEESDLRNNPTCEDKFFRTSQAPNTNIRNHKGLIKKKKLLLVTALSKQTSTEVNGVSVPP